MFIFVSFLMQVDDKGVDVWPRELFKLGWAKLPFGSFDLATAKNVISLAS